MKLGFVGSAYTSVGCCPNKSFRLSSYSKGHLIKIIDDNLNCVLKTLKFCVSNKIFFYRIVDLIPFASHPICESDCKEIFNQLKTTFEIVGEFIKYHGIRISMHPGQYTVINSPKSLVIKKSIDELSYNTTVIDTMGLDNSAKIQLHVGGIYNNKEKAIQRFINNFKSQLSENIKNHLAIENDDRLFDLNDCLRINKETDIPIIFDYFHHQIKNNNESVIEAIKLSNKTWKADDGKLMVDYSNQEPNMKIGRHSTTLDLKLFQNFVEETKNYDFDIILEVRDKEKSALKAVSLLRQMGINPVR